jgi:hypothetical protein
MPDRLDRVAAALDDIKHIEGDAHFRASIAEVAMVLAYGPTYDSQGRRVSARRIPRRRDSQSTGVPVTGRSAGDIARVYQERSGDLPKPSHVFDETV